MYILIGEILLMTSLMEPCLHTALSAVDFFLVEECLNRLLTLGRLPALQQDVTLWLTRQLQFGSLVASQK